MTEGKIIPLQGNALRRRAENELREKGAGIADRIETLPREEAWQMLHELRVHQIELEIQNDELRRAQTELEASRSRYLDLYELAPIGYFTVSEEGLILEANLTAALLLDMKRGDLAKRPFSQFILEDNRDSYFIFIDFNSAAIQISNGKVGDRLGDSAVELYKSSPQILSDMNLCFQERSVVKREINSRNFAPGRHLSIHYGFIPPDLIIVHAEDQTDRKRVEEALQESEKRYRELSIIDGLTQLYNSRYFYHQLKLEIDRVRRYEEQPMTLLLLDLDNFKQFNDTYGHVEGDQVLSRLGQVVKRCLRQTDSAYRYGGEEFTIILPMTTSKDAVITAERIRTEFKKETFSPAPGQGDVHVTVSIGLGQYKLHEDTKVFVNRVDQLMYLAKKNGKDRVCSET